MSTMLQESEQTAMTRCSADEFLWEIAKAAQSRKMCEYEPDQECICAEGEECWLV